ncbi:unnamed protein product [Prorocentrum cordatum]|uniref:Amino acid transporter transmembrane domain-containing protein n=1 Tax=Prorocentrum cordatum TaxID=2364126 RepID=A0ABN9URQ9_9DINO|nr:unnamed protein product [Polarella glacialis]
MPGAFAEGGWLFSSVVLSIIAAVNGACIYRLVQCQQVNPRASFACIADSACGWVGRLAVQVSLVISQFGTCVAYIIFISQLALAPGRSSGAPGLSCAPGVPGAHGREYWSAEVWFVSGSGLQVNSIGHVGTPWIMCVLFPILVPLCLIRSVEHLEYPNLIADILILFGLVVVIVYGCITMASTDAIDTLLWSIRGDYSMWREQLDDPHYKAVVPFRPETCGIFIGMTIFTFEGVPMVLPIRNSMAKKERFIPLFAGVFACISLMFCLFGLIGYISYKRRVETVVLLNLPEDSAWTMAAKFGYMLALCFSTPLMFLPAARITELWAFGASEEDPDKDGDRIWRINAMRTFEILTFCLIAVLCGPYFERFLAFVGALCCAPVAFVYPALFHLILCADGAGAMAASAAQDGGALSLPSAPSLAELSEKAGDSENARKYQYLVEHLESAVSLPCISPQTKAKETMVKRRLGVKQHLLLQTAGHLAGLRCRVGQGRELLKPTAAAWLLPQSQRLTLAPAFPPSGDGETLVLPVLLHPRVILSSLLDVLTGRAGRMVQLVARMARYRLQLLLFVALAGGAERSGGGARPGGGPASPGRRARRVVGSICETWPLARAPPLQRRGRCGRRLGVSGGRLSDGGCRALAFCVLQLRPRLA